MRNAAVQQKRICEERRFLPRPVRSSAADPRTIEGYAAVFDSLSQDLGGFRERVMPGAFARAIRERQDARMLINHDPSLVLGRVRNGTLELAEDSVGLRFRCQVGDTSYGRDLLTSLARGDVSECSFAFLCEDDEWGDETDENGARFSVRSLLRVSLLDTSVVTFPAYPHTSVALSRSAFPDGMPVEMRSRIRSSRNISVRLGNFRRNIFNLIVG